MYSGPAPLTPESSLLHFPKYLDPLWSDRRHDEAENLGNNLILATPSSWQAGHYPFASELISFGSGRIFSLVPCRAATSEDYVDANLTIPALKALRRILRASELSNRQLAGATGLTPSQLLVLQEIEERGQVTPTELSTALQFGQATITNIIDRLESAGLVRRQRGEQDKRRVYLTCTEAGERTIALAPDLLQATFSQEFATLPVWEQAMILAGLDRLSDILGIARSDVAPLLDSGAIDRST